MQLTSLLMNMADSPLTSIFGVFNKLQEKLSSTASSSRPLQVPELNKLNDMVYEVHCPQPEEKPELEVVFFHGLQVKPSEDAYVRTWMSKDNSQLWLQTWLVDLFPKARIFTISYDSSAKRTHESGRLDMYCTAENLVSSLTADEVQIGHAGCPIVLVGHCLGGLVLKELCLSSAWMLGRKSDERFSMQRVSNLFSNLRGMFFYATPHTGSLLGDELHDNFKGALLEEIETFKASSARRNQEFYDLKLKYGWFTSGVGEVSQTYVECLRKYIHVVPEASTRPYMDDYYSVMADHYAICKPQGKTASAFLRLKDFLQQIRDEGVLQARVVADARSRREYVIDLEGRASQVRSMLAQPDTHTVFIVGLSGVGKTTLAQQVFHDISHSFSVTCFVSLDTIEAPSKSNCRKHVLGKIQDALDGVNRGNTGSNRSLSSVLSYFKGRKVLMVLDNVEFEEQLKDLRTETWLEGSASKMIITSTNARLGTASNTFQVPYLNYIESRQLFRHYAFRDEEEPQDLSQLVSQVIEECENFPLALKVLGGYISKENVLDKQLWLDLLDRLRKAQEVDGGHDYRLLAKLRLCYDALVLTEQEVFLDIATFFHGFSYNLVKCIWYGCRESPHLAWTNLKRQFLAKDDEVGNIWMHRLLRNMGQRIACPRDSSVNKWTRISRTSSAKELIEKHQGIVDALALNLQIRENEILTVQNTTFVTYVHLEYLILEGVRTSPGTVELPRSLVYLRWKDGWFTSCPVDFNRLERLVALELIDCKSMKFLPLGVVNANKLMWLELEGCASLTELPLGLPRSLEHLGLNRTSLKNLPSDLWQIKGLRHLQANETQLTRVPQGLSRLALLSSLNLSRTKVTTLPESIGRLKWLRELNLSYTLVTSLPDTIGRLENLENLNLLKTNLGSLPESIGGLQSLKFLELAWTCVKSLPQSLGALVKLEHLSLFDTPLETLPDSICELRCLSFLNLQYTRLGRLPHAMGELVALDTLMVTSRSLRVWFETTRMLSRLMFLTVDLGPLCENPALSSESGEVECRGEENALVVTAGESQMGIHSFLSQLPVLHGLPGLTLGGTGYPQYLLQPLFLALQQMPSLNWLMLWGFNHVEKIPFPMGTLTRLETLRISSFETLREFPESLGELKMLRELVLRDLPKLCRLPESFSALPSLRRLTIQKCQSLQGMPPYFSAVSPSGRNCGPLDSLSPILPHQLKLDVVESDSWRVIECFWDCCGKHSARYVTHPVECEEMEKALRKAIKTEEGCVIDTKVAMEHLTEIGLHFHGGNNGLHEASRACLFHSCRDFRAPHQRFKIECNRLCSNHYGKKVWVMDLHEDSEELEEQDSIMDHEESDTDTKEEDGVTSGGKYRRAVRSLVFLASIWLIVSSLRTA